MAAAATFACSGAPTVGFWFHDDAGALPSGATARLGGPLTVEEIASIKRISQAEIERAFSGLRIIVSTSPRAFWRVTVVQSLAPARNYPLPKTGESMPMGLLGGAGSVGFDLVATKAIDYAPLDASRQVIVDGIGRGIGRVAVHELMHQIVGTAVAHNDSDVNSYEYGSPDRQSQYYGELHWTTAWSFLNGRFGKDANKK